MYSFNISSDVAIPIDQKPTSSKTMETMSRLGPRSVQGGAAKTLNMVIVVMTPLSHILKSECIFMFTIQSHYIEDAREMLEPIAAMMVIDGY